MTERKVRVQIEDQEVVLTLGSGAKVQLTAYAAKQLGEALFKAGAMVQEMTKK